MRWMRSGSYRPSPSAIDCKVVAVPATLTNVRALFGAPPRPPRPGPGAPRPRARRGPRRRRSCASHRSVMRTIPSASRSRARRAPARPHHELGGAAADVEHQERSVRRIEPVRGAQIRQCRLVLAGDRSRGRSRRAPAQRPRTPPGSRRREPRWSRRRGCARPPAREPAGSSGRARRRARPARRGRAGRWCRRPCPGG